MATTATTPSELYEAIDSTIRNQTAINSITPTTHSDLLYNMVEVLSGGTTTTGATLVGDIVYFDRVDSLSAYTVDFSTILNTYLSLTGGTVTGNVDVDSLTIQTLGTGTSVTNLGIDASGNVVSGLTTSGYTETIVNISSAQILAMKNTPIELLPSPNAGEYLHYYGICEFTPTNTPYIGTPVVMIGDINDYIGVMFENYVFTNTSINTRIFEFTSDSLIRNVASTYNGLKSARNTALGVYLTIYSGNDFTNGTGTLRVKIYHKTITFGM